MSEKREEREGLLISFDGLDSSGKETQVAKLDERLRDAGWTTRCFETPDYSTPSGRDLKLRLQGEKGHWDSASWEEKMGYFATNRAEHRDEVIGALQSGEIVIYDRYVPSSLTFITTEALKPREIKRRRQEIHNAIRKLENTINRMPVEDVSIFLDVPPAIAGVLLSRRKQIVREKDEYTDHLEVQKRLYGEYDWMCREDPDHFIRIQCVSDGKLMAVDSIAELVWGKLVNRFPSLEK